MKLFLDSFTLAQWDLLPLLHNFFKWSLKSQLGRMLSFPFWQIRRGLRLTPLETPGWYLIPPRLSKNYNVIDIIERKLYVSRALDHFITFIPWESLVPSAKYHKISKGSTAPKERNGLLKRTVFIIFFTPFLLTHMPQINSHARLFGYEETLSVY